MTDYVPDRELLDRYADLLIGFAPRNGEGIRQGDVVGVQLGVAALPLYAAIQRSILRRGGHMIGELGASASDGINMRRDFFELASDAQLDWFPSRLRRGFFDEIDHLLLVGAPTDLRGLEGIDPARISRLRRAEEPELRWRLEKENDGRLSWTIAAYGTEAMAAEAGLPIEQYWQQMIAALYLDEPDTVGRWREINAEKQRVVAALDALAIRSVHVRGPEVDLRVVIGDDRRWVSSVGINLPSFEVFTTPDWRGTEGWIHFSEPLFDSGTLITGAELEFAAGRVVRADADQGVDRLRSIVDTDTGTAQLGEFSLTDGRLSRIDCFMANTLFDENRGGRYGNTHVALGFALDVAYAGDPTALDDATRDRIGWNRSATHVDIVAASDRTVTATLPDGSETVIYEDGRFTV